MLDESSFSYEITLKPASIKQLNIDTEFKPLFFSELSGSEISHSNQSETVAIFERKIDHRLTFVRLAFKHMENMAVLTMEFLSNPLKMPDEL